MGLTIYMIVAIFTHWSFLCVVGFRNVAVKFKRTTANANSVNLAQAVRTCPNDSIFSSLYNLEFAQFDVCVFLELGSLRRPVESCNG